MPAKVISISELEPIAKELVFHTGEVFSRIFLPAVILGEAKDIKYHATELKRLLNEVV